MPPFRLTAPSLAIALALAGCPSVPTTSPGKIEPASRPAPRTSPRPSTVPSERPAPVVPPIVLPSAAPIIGNNGGNLIGQVRGPATIIGNNGGSFRVLSTLAEVPVAGAKVALLDAAGQAVLDPQGRPYEALTDAQGRYGFNVALPDRNLLLEVRLPDDKGRLRAIVPKRAEPKREVDLDLISALTTGYIMSQYVKTQADPQATLDKLPPEMERETRRKALAAFESSQAGVPPRLTDEEVVKAVTALREQDAGFHAQLETVKQTLIAAGLDDRGNGLPATTVSLTEVRQLVPAPDGSVYLDCPFDGRVWRLTPEGKLVAAVGSGGEATLAATGQLAKDVGFAWIHGVSLDAEGRLLVVGQDAEAAMWGLYRVEADGKLEALHRGAQEIRFAVAGEAGAVWMLLADRTGPSQLVKWAPQTLGPRLVHTFTATESAYLRDVCRYGQGPSGRVWLGDFRGDRPADWKQLDLATFALSPATDLVTRGWYDPAGNLVSCADNHTQFRTLAPDGTVSSVIDTVGHPGHYAAEAGAVGADGVTYLAFQTANNALVYRVEDGKATHVAGTNGLQAGQQASFLALAGFDVDAQGNLFVADSTASQVIKIKPDRKAEIVIGEPGAPEGDDEGALATQGNLFWPQLVEVDLQGNLYVLDTWIYYPTRIRKVDTTGRIRTVYVHPRAQQLAGMASTQDGTVYLMKLPHFGPPLENGGSPPPVAEILRLKGDGTTEVAFSLDLEAIDTRAVFAIAPNDEFWVLAGPKLLKGTLGGTLQTIHTDTRFTQYDFEPCLAVDAKGRVYMGTMAGRLMRFDPADRSYTAIVGPGGTHFTGTGVNDSISTTNYPRFDDAGNLYFADAGNKQIKKVPASEL